MPTNKIVVNASPLIILCKCDLEVLLPQLFQDVVIPQAVWNEIEVGKDVASEKVGAAPWLRREQINIQDEVAVWNLGAGESEVLAFSLSNPEFRAVIDDRAARICAKTLSIPTFGTGALLVLAKKQGLIESVVQCINKLETAGLFISSTVADTLIDQAGE